MKKGLEKLFGLVSALSLLCTPTILLIVGLWMIYNVDLWIGLVLSIVAYFASLLELFELQMYFKDWKKKKSKQN